MWTLVAIPLNKELGLAYNDPYWYRLNNGLRLRAQAVQVQHYYNQPTLPPYGGMELVKSPTAMAAGVEGLQGTLVTQAPINSDPPAAPIYSIIILDHDKSQDAQSSLPQPTATNTEIRHTDELQRTGETGNGLRPTSIIGIEATNEWQQDALTMTEEAYILKHYAKAAVPESGVTMDMYLGLRTGQVLSDRCTLTQEMDRNAMSRSHGRDAKSGKWTM